jgi:Ion channel
VTTAIFTPLTVGAGTTFCTIIIHALALIAIVGVVRFKRRLDVAGVRFWRDLTIIAVTSLVALTAHLIEIAVWAVLFILCGEFSVLEEAFYHSAVNYTSLGYGDMVMSASWRLLGPLETADALLMFGLSTAMVFAVIQQLLQERGGFRRLTR